MSDHTVVSKLSEFDIRQTHISSLAKTLGWHWDNKELSPTELEVYSEGMISSGRPDVTALGKCARHYVDSVIIPAIKLPGILKMETKTGEGHGKCSAKVDRENGYGSRNLPAGFLDFNHSDRLFCCLNVDKC